MHRNINCDLFVIWYGIDYNLIRISIVWYRVINTPQELLTVTEVWDMIGLILFIIIISLILLFISWIMSSPEGICTVVTMLIGTPLYLICGKDVGFEACIIISMMGLIGLFSVIVLILWIVEKIFIPLWNWFCDINGWEKRKFTKKDPFGLDAL